MTELELEDFRTSIDAAITRALSENRSVGTVVLMARDGELVYQRAAGFADREAGRDMGAGTLFRLASVTKTIVSAAAMTLVERDELSLESRVDRWLPEFRPKLQSGESPEITVRQLLTHTAGLDYRFQQPADGSYARANVSDGFDQPGLSFEDNIRRIASAPLVHRPGVAWQYSVAMDVLGAVMERAAGKPLPEIVAERVTRPLDMIDTGFTTSNATRLAVPYADAKPWPKRMTNGEVVPLPPFMTGAGIIFDPSRTLDPASFPSGGGGMNGSASDLLRFFLTVIALTNTALEGLFGQFPIELRDAIYRAL